MASAIARSLARTDLTVAVVVLLVAVEAVIRFRSPLGHDVAWYLYAGGRLLDGAVLYEDVVEVNPPLAIWLTMPIAAMARATGVSSIIVIKAVLLALTACSIALSARFIAAATDISAGAKHLILILLAGLMLFIPASDFGQREHVAIVLAMPWVLLRWNRLVDRGAPAGLAALIGLAAAIGFWMKPHFLMAVLAIELAMIFAARSPRTTVRIENLAIVAFSVAYLVAISMLVPKQLVPLSLLSSRAFIPFYHLSFEDVGVQLILPSALAVAALAGTGLLSPQLQLLRTLLVAAGAGFLFAFIVQAGYPYQLIPALFFLGLAAGLGVAEALAGDVAWAGMGQRIVMAGSAIAVAIVLLTAGSKQSVEYRGQVFEEAIAAEAPGARSIFIASTSVFHAFPLVEEKRLVWASRFPAQWLAPYVATTLDANGGPGDSVGDLALKATVSDLISFAPDIVFVDENPEQLHFRGPPLDYIDFWSSDARFQNFWQSYEKRGVAGGFGVYVRNGMKAEQSAAP